MLRIDWLQMARYRRMRREYYKKSWKKLRGQNKEEDNDGYVYQPLPPSHAWRNPLKSAHTEYVLPQSDNW